jgi:hypothetical protein
MRRLGGSVNVDVIIIDGVTTGDRVVMGDGKFGEVGGGCCYVLQDSFSYVPTYGTIVHM